MSLVFGTCPNCWGVWYASDTLQPPWRQFLDEAASVNYRLTELGPYGYLPTDPGRLGDELSSRGLELVAGTATVQLARPDDRVAALRTIADVARLTSAVGGSFLVLMQEPYRDNGNMTGSRQLDSDGWRELLHNIEAAGALVRDQYDIVLAFHPHADTWVESPAQVERLLAETDPALVSLCLDTGHYEYRGGRSADLLERFHHRIPYLHLKSIRASLADQARADDLGFGEAVAQGVVCEPSDGSVDFRRLATTMRRIGYRGRAVVEHDMYPIQHLGAPLPIAQRALDFYMRLGWTTETGPPSVSESTPAQH